MQVLIKEFIIVMNVTNVKYFFFCKKSSKILILHKESKTQEEMRKETKKEWKNKLILCIWKKVI